MKLTRSREDKIERAKTDRRRSTSCSDSLLLSGERLRSLVAQAVRLDAEIEERFRKKKDLFVEARDLGFDVEILKRLIKRRRESADN